MHNIHIHCTCLIVFMIKFVYTIYRIICMYIHALHGRIEKVRMRMFFVEYFRHKNSGCAAHQEIWRLGFTRSNPSLPFSPQFEYFSLCIIPFFLNVRNFFPLYFSFFNCFSIPKSATFPMLSPSQEKLFIAFQFSHP